MKQWKNLSTGRYALRYLSCVRFFETTNCAGISGLATDRAYASVLNKDQLAR